MTTFQVDIVTPERLVVSASAAMVTLPAVEGQMGVLAGHAPILAALDAGAVLIEDSQGAVKTVTITGGLMEMVDDVCVVLAEGVTVSAEPDHDLC